MNELREIIRETVHDFGPIIMALVAAAIVGLLFKLIDKIDNL